MKYLKKEDDILTYALILFQKDNDIDKIISLQIINHIFDKTMI